jgi:site-specific DNA-methyltransferase (adenine-specific)/modification methylase
MIEINKIYNENCLDTMGRIPDKFVNLIVTSPPYNMNLRIRKGEYCSRQIIKEEFSTKYDNFDDNLPIDDFYKLHYDILKEIIRVSELSFYVIQIVTGSKRAFFKLIGDFNEYIKDIIIWDKVNSQPAMKAGVFNSQFEMILVLGDNSISRQFTNYNFNRGELSNVWKIKRGKKLSNKNGAVFPRELVDKIILNFSNENDIVYDPFTGTGTTQESAIMNNRLFIGSELIKSQFEFVVERINKIKNMNL